MAPSCLQNGFFLRRLGAASGALIRCRKIHSVAFHDQTQKTKTPLKTTPPPTSDYSKANVEPNAEEPERRDLQSYRTTFFDHFPISDSLERVVNRHLTVEMTGGQAIYRLLVNRGVECVFGYSGGAVLPLVDQFHEDGIHFVNNCNEQCAGHAAQAFGKSKGIPGVVVVTSGPGLTNMVTPLQDAFMDGDPLIVLSGQVPTTAMGTDAFQECPATAITKPCTKWNYLALDVESLPWALDTAFRVAMSGRKGPVHIDLPKNVLAGVGKIPAEFLTPRLRLADLGQQVGERENARLLKSVEASAMHRLVDLLNVARQPVIIAGHGAVNAFQEVRSLALQADIPVATTLHGLGIFDERHPLSLQMLGMHGSASANFAIQEADLILAVGSRFDDRATGVVASYAPAARRAASEGRGGIVHLDIEQKQVGKIIEADLAIVADCKAVLTAVTPLVEKKSRAPWRAQIDKWKSNHPFSWRPAGDGRIKTQQVVESIYKTLQKQHVARDKQVSVCTGVGNHQMMTAQFFKFTRPRQMVTSGGLGTMGAGLPFAIGTQLANPDDVVVLIDGDGSFNMTSVDLVTVSRQQLPIKIAIMNDGVQQMVRAWQKLFFGERYVVTDNHNPDYCTLAEAYGIRGLRVEKDHDLDEAVEKFLTYDGPILADFRVVPDLCLPMVKPGNALNDMLLPEDTVPTVMEGLAPS